MVRRRGDESHARARKAQARDHLIDLVPGQLPALARLRSLRDLDLQHFGVDQIFRGHAEAAGGHLFDLGVPLTRVARGVLPAFARIRARPQAVHGDGERLMRLRRQSTQRHSRAVEARQDRLHGFNFLKRNALVRKLKRQQIAEGRRGPMVHERRETLVERVITACDCGLQGCDHLGVVHVVFTIVHVLEEPALLDGLAAIPRARRKLHEITLEVREVRSLHAAFRAGEAQVNDLIVQADDLKELRASVAADGRDAHLGHDLEEALPDAGAVTAPELKAGREVELHRAAAHHLEQHLVGHVRIHGGCAVADETGEVMRIAGGAGLNQQIALAAQARPDEVLVHGPGRKQRVRRQPAANEVTVGKEQHELVAPHRSFRLRAQTRDRSFEPLFGLVLQVKELVGDAELGQSQDLPELPLREDRRAEHNLAGVLWGRLKDIALRSDLRLQRHYDRLAQRIDRRVCHLRELLPEIIVKRAHLVRQHRHRRVIAHGANRFALILGEHADDLIALFARDVEHLLVERERVAVHRFGRQARVNQIGLKIAHALSQPRLVGVARL